MLVLCLMLLGTYYVQNYDSIIGISLSVFIVYNMVITLLLPSCVVFDTMFLSIKVFMFYMWFS